MAGNYKRMLRLLENWPLDKNKKGRDFGEYLRQEVETAFKSNKFETEQELWDKKYLALQKIADDYHYKKYPRHSTSTATGLTAEQCNQCLSPEFLEEFEKEDRGLFRSIFSFWPTK